MYYRDFGDVRSCWPFGNASRVFPRISLVYVGYHSAGVLLLQSAEVLGRSDFGSLLILSCFTEGGF